MSMSHHIQEKLTLSLTPKVIEVKDESHLHAGHVGARLEGESHFRLLIVSDRFVGLNRVARQRLVNEVLKEELVEKIHALTMKTYTQAEYAAMSD